MSRRVGPRTSPPPGNCDRPASSPPLSRNHCEMRRDRRIFRAARSVLFLAALAPALYACQGAAECVTQEPPKSAASLPPVRSPMDRADLLSKAGRHQEAASELLWCLDHGAEAEPRDSLIWVGLVPRRLVRMGEQWPEAITQLRRRLDDAEGRLLGPEGCAEKLQKRCRWDAELVTAGAEALGEADRPFVLYRRLESHGPGLDDVLEHLWPAVFRYLWEHQQYPEIALRGASVRKMLDGDRAIATLFERRGNVAEVLKRRGPYAETTGKLFASLLAVGKRDEAMSLLDQAAKEEPAWKRALIGEMARRAVEAGDWNAAKAAVERGAADDAGGHKP
jgi:hypothetical protein